MRLNNSIATTGAVAATVTVAFAIFIYAAAEWSAPASTPLSTETCSNQTTTIIPQIAVGSFDDGVTTYATTIHILNTSGAASAVSARFYKDRPNESSVPNDLGLNSPTALTGGHLPSTPLQSDAAFVIRGGGKPKSESIGWGKVTACGAVSVSTVFEIRDNVSGRLYSRAAIGASPANLSKFIIPRIRDSRAGLESAFAVVNTGTADAILAAELVDADGKTVGSEEIVMAGGSHKTQFVNELFSKVVDTSSDRTFQYVRFSSSSASFAAAGIAVEGKIQTNIPVERIQ